MSGAYRRQIRVKRAATRVALRETLRHSATVTIKPLRTSDYPKAAQERLAEAVAQARRAAGHRWRPSFALEAGISKRSLEAVELADASVGISVLEDIGRALGRHFPAWNADSARVILDGGTIPALELAEEPTDINEEMLESLHHLKGLLLSTRHNVMSDDEANEFMDRLLRDWKQKERDRGRYLRTVAQFREEAAQRHIPSTERKSTAPNE